MKKVFVMMLSFVIVFASFTGNVFAGGKKSVGNVQPDEFQTQLSEMIREYENEDYFISMSVTLGENTIDVDGETIPMDSDGTTAYAENGRIMMPVRAVAEAMGAEVSYDSRDKSVTVETPETMVIMTIGEEEMEVNGESVELLTPPTVVNQRTMLPVRDVAEALDCEVEWIAETDTAVFTRQLQTKRIIAFEENVECQNMVASVSDGDITVMQFDTIDDTRLALEELESRGIKAEPDYIRKSEAMSWGTPRIGADDYSKDIAYADGDEVVTAIVDTGVDLSHSMLNSRLVKGYDLYDGDSNPQDVQGHGTHVAGIVVDVSGNNSNVKIMPVKVFGEGRYTSSSLIAQGIRYAADKGADVINLSVGGEGVSELENSAVNYAYGKNIAVVAAAGNNSADLTQQYYTPACIKNAITVSAMTQDNSLADFSNYGKGIVDFAAPGVNIESARLGGGTTQLSGTSMATPFVAGAYALVKTVHPNADVDDITYMLSKNAIGLGNSSKFGSGCVYLKNLEKDFSSVSITKSSTSGGSYDSGIISGSITYEGIKPQYVGIRLGTSSSSMKEVYKVKFSSTGGNAMGLRYTAKNLKSGTKYYAEIFAESAAGSVTSNLLSFETDYYEPVPQPKPEPEPEPQPQPKPEPKPEPIKSDLRILPDKYPSGNIAKGESFGLSGRIKSNCHITDVRSYILDSNKNIVMEASGWTTTQTYVIEGSALDKGMKFGNLSQGTYYLRYTASDESGNHVTWTSNAFVVEEVSNSSLRILPDDYPKGTLRQGRSFGLSGRIKSNCHITGVRAYILDSNKNIVMEASGWTTTQTYVIEGSALDKGMKFNNLAEGGYYLKFYAADESGKTITWTSDMFYIIK